ncbi:hypothetical protein D3C78_1021000 [compost metagenome]
MPVFLVISWATASVKGSPLVFESNHVSVIGSCFVLSPAALFVLSVPSLEPQPANRPTDNAAVILTLNNLFFFIIDTLIPPIN